MEPKDVHPDLVQLREFASGQIADEEAFKRIESHISNCDSCGKQLMNLPADIGMESIRRWTRQSGVTEFDGSAHYEKLEVIGRGGSGVVWRARQKGVDRLLAYKSLLSGVDASPSELARIRREARVLGQLDHPNIVRVHDFGEQDGVPFLAMELIEGPTLAELLGEGPLEPALSARWVRDLARAIGHAHRQAIMHRDLKPHNVLLSPDTDSTAGKNGNTDERDLAGREMSQQSFDNWTPKLVDFGLVRMECDRAFRTATGEAIGTPAYLAPEMSAGKPVGNTVAVDVYGLGAILYHCLTGRPPYVGSSVVEILKSIGTDHPPSIRSLRPSVSRDLVTICEKCMEQEPGRRFSSAHVLAEELDRYLDGRPILSRPISRVERVVRWCRRNPSQALGVGVVGLAVLAMPVLMIYHNASLRQERNFAQSRYESTRKTLWSMLDKLGDNESLVIPRLAELSAEQTESARLLFEELATADPGGRSELDLARVEIQAATLASVLGESDKARQHLIRAKSLCEDLRSDSEIGSDADGLLVSALNKLYASQLTEQPEQKTAWLEQAREISREYLNRNPHDTTWLVSHAWTMANLGAHFRAAGENDRAIPLLQESIEIRDRLAAGSPDPAPHREAAAGSRINLAAIELARGNKLESEALYARAIADLEKNLAQFPDDVHLAELMAEGLVNQCNCFGELGRFDDSISCCTRAIELLQSAIQKEPAREKLGTILFLVTANRAHWRAIAGQFDMAAMDWSEAIAIAHNPATATYCRQMMVCALAKAGDPVQAVRELALIDESSLDANGKFLQAIAWVLTGMSVENNPGDFATSKLPDSEIAEEHALSLLTGLREAGLFEQQTYREHLRDDIDWQWLRNRMSREAWSQIAGPVGNN